MLGRLSERVCEINRDEIDSRKTRTQSSRTIGPRRDAGGAKGWGTGVESSWGAVGLKDERGRIFGIALFIISIKMIIGK